MIYCFDFLRGPLRACKPLPTAHPPFLGLAMTSTSNQPPGCWFLKKASISINVNNMYVNVTHTRAQAPPHTWDKRFLHILNVCWCVLPLSGWFVFVFCDSCLCTVIVLMKGPEIVQNHFHESKESFQRKAEMLL